MKRILAIFAHPDDESLCPGGTIAKWAKEGATIHLISTTHGEAGNNHTKLDTGVVRTKELQNAAKILGIQKVTFLNYKDGQMCNNDLQQLMMELKKTLYIFKPDTLLTFDLNGISGHIDHITVSSAVTKVFDDTTIARKLYYCTETEEFSNEFKDYFIHFPDGRCEDEIDETIDVSDVWEIREKAMRAHISQMEDVVDILRVFKKFPKHEHFMVRKK